MKPTTGIACCCARAVSGHAAKPPTNVMNSRRLMSAPDDQDKPSKAPQTSTF